MGKFFEAMQRAAGARSTPEKETVEESTALPQLDDSLLDPEWTESDVFKDPDTEDNENATDEKRNPDTPSAVIRTLESELKSTRPGVRQPPRPVEPDSVPPIHVDGPDSVKPPESESRADGLLRQPVETVVRVHPAYDKIVQRLKSYRRKPRQGVVLVTSSVAQEGTSTIARNVATALSQAGTERILLIDGNLRTPSQHTAFGVPRAPGFSEVLKGDASLTSVILDDLGSGISLMTSGARVKSPSQVLTPPAIEGVTVALLSLYDWIVIDGPPATVHPDVASIGTACGGSILVVRAENTRSEVAEEAKSILEGSGTEIVGAVLNRRRFHIPSAIYRRL